MTAENQLCDSHSSIAICHPTKTLPYCGKGNKKQRFELENKKTGSVKKMQVTNHALERYAERVCNKSKQDISAYVAQNKEKIEEWIG